jgi:hypothetical protein
MDRFYEEIQHVFDHFPKYHAKFEQGDIFKPTIGNDSLHQDSNDKYVRIANFAAAKKSSCKEHDVPTPKNS